MHKHPKARFQHGHAYHWWIVVSCCGMLISSLGISINCSGVFYAPMAEALAVGRGDISMYLMIMNIITGLLGPVVIRLSKKHKMIYHIRLGSFLTCAALLSWSYVQSIWQFYAAAVFHGIGNAMIGIVVSTVVLGNWFHKRTGLVLGLAFSFSGITGALLTPVLQNLIESVGWRSAHLAAAGIALVVLIPAVLMVREHPSNVGLTPYGGSAVAADEALDTGAEQNIPGARKRAVYIICLCAAGFFVAFTTSMGQHIAGHATSIGLTDSVGAYMISAVMVGNMSSKILLGMLCDKIGAFKAFLLFTVLTLGGFVIMGLSGNTNMLPLVVAAFLIGFSYSLSGIGLSQVVRRIFSRGAFGGIYAYVTTSAMIGASISFPMIGYSYDALRSYTPSLFLCAGISLLAIVLTGWVQLSLRPSAVHREPQ